MGRRHDARNVLAAGLSPGWRAGGASFKRQPVQYRYNTALNAAVDKAAYPTWVEVTVPLRVPVRYGLVDRSDLADVTAVEQVVTRDPASGAVLAGQVTTIGSRTYLVYSADPGLAADIDRDLTARLGDRRALVRSGQDPQWAMYRQWRRLRRRTFAGMAVLALMPLLVGGITAARLGAGWGLGEFVALLAGVAALLVVGRFSRRESTTSPRPGWLVNHPVWGFVLTSYVMSAMVFFFPVIIFGRALGGIGCAAVAVIAGVVITAVVWPAQLRYYAELRARAAELPQP
jgi:uncharacterized protein DUF695